ncbi:LRR receptor-like serine/threonine-protein kinase IOS1 [Durio zibethinus]|uniref:LRR receptor-like serine/threonine-protein kinase IOS1 n=1 Tax=Durio zibethinus TaxID=66656 RepID=A0A6P5WER5_DURZI|nr:LRR receptor-like serine/threonine-protein kinase IOS1 [Durio zibethinus]
MVTIYQDTNGRVHFTSRIMNKSFLNKDFSQAYLRKIQLIAKTFYLINLTFNSTTEKEGLTKICCKIEKLESQMRMRSHFLLFSIFVLQALVIHAQNQSGFISLDCGSPEGSSYNEATTGITYTSDAPYIQTGKSNTISDQSNSGKQQQLLEYLRSFSEGDRNCYMLNLTKGDKYLIRTTFMYGNYDGKNKVPEFDLHLGTNFWATIVFQNASTLIVKEFIHVLQSNYLHVCLVNTEKGIPIISALEFRLLKNTTYNTRSEKESLELFFRNYFGSTSNSTVRFPEDVYDRIGTPYQRNDLGQISTSSPVTHASYYDPPSLAMRTASTPANASQPLNFSIYDSDSNAQFYFYMHLAELEELQANQSREFITYLNDELWFTAYSPTYLRADTIQSIAPEKGGQFSMVKTERSTHPPILNAFEAYEVKELLQPQTVEKEVDAMMNIKSMYGLIRNWQGDPCAPKEYLWEGLNCSYNDSNQPTIISLNLSSRGLTGEIPLYIVNLTQLQYLDLSNNYLKGAVPEFLTQLQSLIILNLTRNGLNGSVPAGLIEKSNRGLLQLSVDENQIPCTWKSCMTTKSKNNSTVVVPLLASVASVLFLLVIIVSAVLWTWYKGTKPSENEPFHAIVKDFLNSNMLIEPALMLSAVREMIVDSRRPYQNELKNRQFTYSEVQRITNSFARVIGKGGFGTVYHGCLGDTEVAVKMLSKSSSQGYKQFEAEVEILLRVHHRNFTTLIGYCDDGTNTGLIYEYMAKGNLSEYLSDKSNGVLNWEGRLGMALEAAQGLEYLHCGCKPPIIHRDVKSSNILLTENLQAKLSDFGLSRSFEGVSHVSTVVAGTPGYLDPEYSTSNRLTEKSDVYSFGVVLLEIITNRPVFVRNMNEPAHISHWVGSMLSNGDIQNIADSRLQGDFEINSVRKAIDVAMACLSPSSTGRPTMNNVVTELSECLLAEINRTRGVNVDESPESIAMASLNFDSDITLPRSAASHSFSVVFHRHPSEILIYCYPLFLLSFHPFIPKRTSPPLVTATVTAGCGDYNHKLTSSLSFLAERKLLMTKTPLILKLYPNRKSLSPLLDIVAYVGDSVGLVSVEVLVAAGDRTGEVGDHGGGCRRDAGIADANGALGNFIGL